ncbi:carbohydrate ABC transporter permease [Sporomusa sp.]|uniref:carbohydrate ABC transporter permease n=1 Tax=Sporomusa sp. TaxID=2078658 RepID=UPI002B902B9A|nr:carbohydrate ABC transporter permease [Sporomusa sp.]HWR45910.1 carbohydrate ABC transporter permease [Sporomusa sp.]
MSIKRESISYKLGYFYLPLAALLIFSLFPFLWTFITSIKSQTELFSPVLQYFPTNPTWENYRELFIMTSFMESMWNSFIVAGASSVVSLVISLMAAYAFSRYRFRGRLAIMVSFLTINMFPPVLLLIPLYSIMRGLGILYTPYALIIAYSTFTIPFAVWLLTGYLNDLPLALEEAALIDGCNRRQAFFKIILPLSVPGVIATGIYIFITAWNEFIFAVMFTNQETRTLPVALQAFVGQFDIQWGLLSAGGVITSLPILILFVFIQKRLVAGLTAGAVKG